MRHPDLRAAATELVESKGAGVQSRTAASADLSDGGALLFAALSVHGHRLVQAQLGTSVIAALPASEPTTENYQRLLSGEEIPFVRQFFNSSIVTVSQTVPRC
jgi:ABC-type glycerol-3-phosphate transport system permease component